MRRPLLFLSFLVLCVLEVKAQKVLAKSWDAAPFQKVIVVSDAIFQFRIATTEELEIRVITKIEGEHCEQLVLETFEDAGVLHIGTAYAPYFEVPNDKLAAHKVMSIEMDMYIPKGLSVHLSSSLASVEAGGVYDLLLANLKDGSCYLKDFRGSASIATRGGDITVQAHRGSFGEATSEHGTVINELPKAASRDHKDSIFAVSVNGDITLKHYQ